MTIVVGSIAPMGFDCSTAPPPGWLFCDGSAVSRATYASLFAAIGTAWGEGDGNTTFNLPDLRGYFVRGVNGNGERDPDASTRLSATLGGSPGNAVGSLQGYATGLPQNGGLATDQPASTNHVHSIANLPNSNDWYNIAGSHYASWNSGTTNTSADGDHSHTCGVGNGAGGDDETRPVNVYADYLIWTGPTVSGSSAGSVPTGSYPIGTVVPLSGPVNDQELQNAGWVFCDGRAVSRTVVYNELFAAIGTAYGQGDGVSSFNVPDFRGNFQRGVSGSSGNDPDANSRVALQSGGNTGNNIGSFQPWASGQPNNAMQTSTNGDHTHTAPNIPTDKSSYWIGGSYECEWNSGSVNTNPAGLHQHAVIGGGDTETRPVNANCNFIIKFTQI